MNYDYKILQAARAGILASQVNSELTQGYVLVGQPFVHEDMFYQAMVKSAPAA